ncbi:DUF1127 domain-containing protein [Martelella mangrovi]|uniref:Uncharacterized protein YjiS (DUF1127 family) n=1 Tax=Martelella mangrovi TaxID=1397477 RepID=A0ABV2I9S7_9HYPH
MSLIERASESRSLAHRPHFWIEGLRAFRAAVARFVRNRSAIRYMNEMDDALLKDIGLDRAEVERAYMSTVKEDPMVELQQAACNRAQRMVL